MKKFFNKPVDLKKLKANVLRNLEEQSSYWGNYAKKLHNFTEEVKNCPICNSNQSSAVVTIYNFIYLQCESCTHVYNSSRLNSKMRKSFYREIDKPISYSDTYTDKKVQKYRLEHVAQGKVDFIQKHINKTPSKWLDLACGNGDIIYLAEKLGHNITGVESNEDCINYAKEFYGLKIDKSKIENYNPKEKFDIISLLGITDLIPDPNALLKKCYNLLEPNGIIAVEFPNYNSLSTLIQKSFPNQIVCRHMYPTVMNIYTYKSVELLLKNIGLNIDSIWWYGMDIYELTTNLMLIEPKTKISGLSDSLFLYMNNLQETLDKNEQSDNFFIIAKKQ